MSLTQFVALSAARLDDDNNATVVSEHITTSMPPDTTTKILTIPVSSSGDHISVTTSEVMNTTFGEPIDVTTEKPVDATTDFVVNETTTEIAYSWNCTFDHDWCGMTNTANDDFDWTRTSHPTGTSRTGK